MAPKKKGKGKKKQAQQRTKKAPSAAGAAGPGSAAAPGPATSGEPSQHEPASAPLEDGTPPPQAGPEPGDRGELAGLRSRPELNGRRVEVRGQAAGKDGPPRFRVELLFGAGAGTVLKVKAANLELDKDRVLDPAMATLVTAMQALAPGATPAEERRDWAGGLPDLVLAKIAETHVARTEAGWAAFLKHGLHLSEKDIQDHMAKRERDGNCPFFVFAMVCKEWRKAQLKVGGPLRTRVESDVIMPGSVALAKWALAEGCPRDHRDKGILATMAEAAAQQGHMMLVRWLIQEQGFAMDPTVMGYAAQSGNLKLVRWLRGEGCDWSANTCRCAAEVGRLEVLQWLRANGCPWNAETCSRAAGLGHLATLRWARKNGCPWDANTCNLAAQNGHLETLRWARKNGCGWNAETCFHAAYGGQLETLRWARENGCDWSAKACAGAAQNGHPKVLQWLRANGCPWDANTCNGAAGNGQLETLRWARENGCDWSTMTCAYAAYGGHLQILKSLRAEGCPWDHNTCHQAVDQGHVEVLQWARENGAPWVAATRDRAAAELGYTDDLGNLV